MVGQTGLVNLGMVTGLGEGKLHWKKIDLVSVPACVCVYVYIICVCLSLALETFFEWSNSQEIATFQSFSWLL